MFYFFRRKDEYIRCEIRGAMDSPHHYELVVVEPSGAERIERYSSSTDIHDRWLQLQRGFEYAGWSGSPSCVQPTVSCPASDGPWVRPVP
ncbi:MAG: hypothetical protein ABI818_14165 [Acidobacteriota bacterium]